jgi:hypothetical protein
MAAPKFKQWITPEGQNKIREWVAEGLTDAKVAERMGVSKALLSKWRQTKPEIRAALVRLKTVDGKTVDAHDLPHGAPPRKLNNVNELQVRIDKWFERCRKDKIPPTRTGLCIELNISKGTLDRYLQRTTEQSTVFQKSEIDGELRPVTVSDVLKRAVLMIENGLEIRMITGRGNVTGIIFDLKNNHGYADKKEVTNTPAAASKVSKEDIDKRIRELINKANGLDIVPFRKDS